MGVHGTGARGVLVSFVMPVWRPRPDWLKDAVLSTLRQEDCRLELIVVDDGCPEPVAELLAGIDDDRLRVVRVPHGGECRARNAGIAHARGDRVRFVDGDDVLKPTSTARLLRLMGHRDDVIAYGATVFCDAQLRPRWTMSSRLRGSATVDCLLGRFSVRVPAMLFTRRTVELTGQWDPEFSVSQDWDFVLRALDSAEVQGTRVPAFCYRRHEGGATSDLSAGLAGARRVVERYFERHPEQPGALRRKTEAMLEAKAARIYATHGQPRAALAPLGRAMLLDPRLVADELTQVSAAALSLTGRALSRRALGPRRSRAR